MEFTNPLTIVRRSFPNHARPFFVKKRKQGIAAKHLTKRPPTSRTEPLPILRRLDKATDDDVLDQVWVGIQEKAAVVEDVPTISGITAAKACLWITPQVTEILHRHKRLLVKLIVDFRTFGNRTQHLCACLTRII